MTSKPALAEKIQSLFAQGSTAAAGKLQMIGMSELRERLGARWEKSRDQIMTTVERAINQEMNPGDIYFKIDELAYVILFNDREVHESRLICANIAQNVCRKLFGDDENVIRVRSLTCSADGSLLSQDVDFEESLNALIEAEGEEEIFGGAEETLELNDALTETDPQIGLLDTRGASAKIKLADLKFQYSPIWDVSKRVVVTYLCRVHLPGSGAAHAERFVVAEEPEDQVQLDLRILEDCISKIREIRDQNRRVLLACPIHWSTIARARSWALFKPLVNELSSDIVQDLIVCLHGLDAGLPNIRIIQELPKLLNRGRAVYACVGYGDKAVERFASTKTAAVGFALPSDFSDERAIMSFAREFCVAADAKCFPAFAFSVATRSLAVALIGMGYRYLEGPAIRPAISVPRDGFHHETIDLFRNP